MSKIFLVHPFPIIRDEVRLLIEEQYPASQVNCYETLSLLPSQLLNKKDILIIHIDQSNIDALKSLNTLKNNELKILIWIESEDESLIKFILQQKFYGYLLNQICNSEFLDALEKIQNGLPYLHPNLSSILLSQYISESQEPSSVPCDSILTKREWDVLQLIATGCSNENIAKQLFLTESTVKNHVSSILHKLEVPDRTSAVLKALKNKWVSLEF
ncbi:response regulator transcription factor [Fictibacillus sp. NPDC058756]|uniref:response regulator transcription factor n=1 Tax=Fictibacillus sp. NPDC058756 TaxID=3346625 RepID=UPI0036B2DC10